MKWGLDMVRIAATTTTATATTAAAVAVEVSVVLAAANTITTTTTTTFEAMLHPFWILRLQYYANFFMVKYIETQKSPLLSAKHHFCYHWDHH
ncbi:hypothetical protein M0804_011449 [Polistes exclamans]|nr:hypothetical protein M0804_011449 [Polistes exclamans]